MKKHQQKRRNVLYAKDKNLQNKQIDREMGSYLH